MPTRSALGRRRGTSDVPLPAGTTPSSQPLKSRAQTFSTGADETQPVPPRPPRPPTRAVTPNSSFCTNCSEPLDRVDSRPPPGRTEYDPVFSPDSVFSPNQSSAQTPSLRSRAQSITSGISDKFRTGFIGDLIGEATIRLGKASIELGERIRSSSHKSQRKAERKQAGKPSRPDLFEKPGTQKLERFWSTVEGEDFSETLKKSIVHPHLNTQPGTELLPPLLPRVVEEDIPPVPELPPEFVVEQFRKEPSRPRARKVLPLPSTMDASRLAPAGRSLADQQDKARRVKDARDLYESIVRNAERSGTSVPPFDFLELIGKGAFGRVYKCRDQRNGSLVAIKIVNIDEQDWSDGYSLGDTRDRAIKDVKKEVSILQQLKYNKAKNVNVIHDAFDWHSQLWIVADYCTGGSVRTLMRPYERDGKSQGLPEEYIIPIAREMAVAMKSMHDLHIIHRDIKCANVYITEQGKIQLGDFGIVGVIDHDNLKRNTIVGTPHWMPREMVEHLGEDKLQEGYGNEVDIWSYGCTIYEMATGYPPYSNKIPVMIPDLIQQSPPELVGSAFSAGLRDLVKFCLNPDKDARPSAADILDHPYLRDSNRKYPTERLIRLIEKFKIWEHGGGSRASLWMASAADPQNQRSDNDQEQEAEDNLADWNFSTSEDFDQEFTRRLSQMPLSEAAQLDGPAGAGLPPPSSSVLTVAERIKQEHTEKSAVRGGKLLDRIFNVNDPSGYQLKLNAPGGIPQSSQLPPPPTADLPLRSFTNDAPTRESMIVLDLDEADVSETAPLTFSMNRNTINEDTIRPAGRHNYDDDDDTDDYTYGNHDEDKRATMEWSFPGAPAAPNVAKRDTMAWKFPTEPAAPKPKRGTMDWTFDSAEPAEPDQDEEPISANFGLGFMSGSRPQLKHAATEQIGHFRDFSCTQNPSAMDANRDSVRSMIDLDGAGFDDNARYGAEMVRSSTASSHMVDTTSGDPFDLEDNAKQRGVKADRFSYHKQWRSEGGPEIKRNSHKTMPMHERGSSLSSTEADIPQSGIEGGYGALPTQPTNMRFSTSEQGLGLADDEQLGNHQWPNFSGFNGQSSHSREPSVEPGRPEVEFPLVSPPNPDAMGEGAEEQALEAEVNKMLADLDHGLLAVTRALRQSVGIEGEDDEPSSDIDSGL